MNPRTEETMQALRLERQVRRLRNLLADALARGRSRKVVARLEKNLQRRWSRLEAAGHY